MKKLFALVLTCSLIFTATAVSGMVSAENAENEEVTTLTQDSAEYSRNENNITAPEGENNLKDAVNLLEYYDNNTLTTTLDSKTLNPSFFDGVVAHEDPDSVTGVNLTASTLDQTDNYIQMQFRINGKLNAPQQFILAMHTKTANNNGMAFTVQHYAVFASQKYSELFNDSSKIIEVKNENKGRTDVVDTSKLALNDITYVAVRVYKTGHQNLFITEMGFFGGSITDYADNFTTEHTVSTLDSLNAITDKNQLIGSKANVTFYKEGTWFGGEEVDTEPNASIFDGKFSVSTGIGKWKHDTAGHECNLTDAQNGSFQTDTYLQLQAELPAAVSNPRMFAIGFHEKDAGKKYKSSHYAVFASSDSSSLYNPENKIIEIIDKTDRFGDTVDLSEKTGLNNIKYIGIRFYNRGYSASPAVGNIQHLTEVGLYGGTTEALQGDVNGDGKIDATDLDELRIMLLSGTKKDGYVYDVNGISGTDIRDLVFVNELIK